MYRKWIAISLGSVLLVGGIIFLGSSGLYKKLVKIYQPQKMVTEQELRIVAITQPGEKIFFGCGENKNWMYLISKDRKLANRVPYMFAWYLDWYMEWCLEDLDKVNVAVWDPSEEIWWGYTEATLFREKIKAEFNFIGDDIWVRR
jgi:hypothetical protein